MRHAQFLIVTFGVIPSSPFGMPRCPWRKGKQWPLKPEGVIEPHAKPTGGDSGDTPRGKLPKNKRLKSGPPGSGRGVCVNMFHPGECYCGKHWNMSTEERVRLMAKGRKDEDKK